MHFLKRSIKYRRVITAFLIALYAFIITPSLFWHQHQEIKISSSVELVSDQNLPVIGEDQDIYCQICSHHYSYYSNDAVYLELNKPTYSGQFLPETLVRFCSINLSYPAERGPPARI